MSVNPEDIVLDFFMGTGTTCAVAHKMGRQYIGVEQLDYGENSAVVRLKNVINGDQSGISKAVNWQGGGDLVSCELKEFNERFIRKIQEAKEERLIPMAFSGEGRGLNKNILVKTIQTMNQHLPNRRLNLTELLAMEKPGIRGKDNTFSLWTSQS